MVDLRRWSGVAGSSAYVQFRCGARRWSDIDANGTFAAVSLCIFGRVTNGVLISEIAGDLLADPGNFIDGLWEVRLSSRYLRNLRQVVLRFPGRRFAEESATIVIFFQQTDGVYRDVLGL